MKLRRWIKDNAEIRRITEPIKNILCPDWFKSIHIDDGNWGKLWTAQGKRKLVQISKSKDEMVRQRVLLLAVLGWDWGGIEVLARCLEYGKSTQKGKCEPVSEAISRLDWGYATSDLLSILKTAPCPQFKELDVIKGLLTYNFPGFVRTKLMELREDMILDILYCAKAHLTHIDEFVFIEDFLTYPLSDYVRVKLLEVRNGLLLNISNSLKCAVQNKLTGKFSMQNNGHAIPCYLCGRMMTTNMVYRDEDLCNLRIRGGLSVCRSCLTQIQEEEISLFQNRL